MRTRHTYALAGLIALACGGGAAPMPQMATDPPAPERADPVMEADTPAPPAPPAVAVAPPQVAGLDTVRAGRFDNGRMWTFENPPADYLRDAYGIDADSVWFRRARLGALRIPGCSASFVSGDGLVLTNHHCAREHISAVSREGESLLDDGFYAESMEEERAIEEFEADRLIAIRDVTAEMDAALEGINEPQARSQARASAEEEIAARISEEYGGEDAGFEVEMVSLYNGGRTSAYVFRRYTDVRMVMAPELSVGYFGGDPDNFTYPRYALDFTFLRVYEDGDPLDTSDNFFRWSETGVESGDAVFMVGNPGSTSRIQTVAELEFRRDVSDKGLLAFVNNRIDALEAFYDMDPEAGEAMDLRNTIFSLINTQEAYGGILRGLHDPVILAKRRDQERAFQEALEADPELAEEYGGLIAQIAELQERKALVAGGFGSFLAFASPDYESAVLSRALFAFQYANGSRAGAPAEALEGVMTSLSEVPGQPAALQELLLAARLRDISASYGPDSPLATSVLGGRSPEDVAASIVAESVLADSAGAVDAVRSGTAGMGDPAMLLLGALISGIGPFQQALGPISAEEEQIAAALGRARFEVYGTDVPPDATFSLRIADGVVSEYEYNGTFAPVVTTFYGLYDRHYSHMAGGTGDGEWDLPGRWLDPPGDPDLSTPINFVSTNDIIGGNSGSPLVNAELELVGLAFDSNTEGLSGEYIFLTDRARAVSVDVRGILEALEEVYLADRIVEELRSGG
ncbi:MAG: S46 family peptidase [Gammaproteobacteria bacterium]|nr:S46 family peptidase [Gammaproteobacteria bacterium]MDE0260621.1 S46 family peptidase [Gammaproteobacteria bacterium]